MAKHKKSLTLTRLNLEKLIKSSNFSLLGHRKELMRIFREDEETYNKAKEFAYEKLSDTQWCKDHKFKFNESNYVGMFEVMYDYLVKEGYIKNKYSKPFIH